VNTQAAPTARNTRHNWHSIARLQGHWLVLARGLWIALIGLVSVITLESLPNYLAQLQTPCEQVSCQYQQLSFGQAPLLASIGLPLARYAALTVAILLAGVIVCWAVSALIVWRRSDDLMAYLVALMLIALGPLPVSTALPVGPFPLRALNDYLIFIAQALLIGVFFLFPSGHFESRWARRIFLVLVVVQIIAFYLPDTLLLDYTTASQPGWLVAVSEMAVVVGIQFYRYRRISGPVERQQTKWVLYGLALPILMFVGFTVLLIGFPQVSESNAWTVLVINEFEFLLPLCLSLSFGLAILRYRLWDIDTLINRTLVYGTLTLLLTAIFVGLVIGMQALLGGVIGQDSRVVIILSTLAIAALFQPVRTRLQSLIDRRFYRHKYDVAKTLEHFSATLNHEMDLDTLREQVLSLVSETMQPAKATLWLRTLESPSSNGDPTHPRLHAQPGHL
jgi:hypothetical protein